MIDSLCTIDSDTLVDRVERQLIKLFVSDKVNIGDSIPKETDLAETFGVSRTVIREALSRLRMIGLIDSKKKRGAILTNPDLLSLLKKSFYPTVLSDEALKDVFEMRLVLEVGMADLIFANITNNDLEDLDETASKEPDRLNSILFEIKDELKFHGKLYEITGNKTLIGFQMMFLPVFNYVHHSQLLKGVTELAEFVSHKDLVTILKNGNPEEFRIAMRAHLEYHYRRLLLTD